MSGLSRGKLILWGMLAVPAAVMLIRFALTPDAFAGDLLAPSGEWSARFIILALMLTPLGQLLPQNGAVRWLLRHRRAVGVAAFLYALLHLVAYVIDMETLGNMLAELGAPAIWTGWLALLAMVPPALTSTDRAMRALRATWKRLQQLAYPAAVLTLVHWVLVHDGTTAALAHFAPLAALQLWRLARTFKLHQERKYA